jgi:trehalose 6-phosphate phosphatase
MHWQDARSTSLQRLLDAARPGVITDVDGTISPIVAHPDAAQVTPRSRDLLRDLHAHLALVAVISGRAVADVQARVNLPELVYVGNHGLEWWIDGQVQLAPEAAAHRPALEAALDAVRALQVPGMIVEDKGATLSVHYRQTSDPDTVAATFTPILQRIADERGLKLFQGRLVFEVRPPIQVNKGSAFSDLITYYHLDAAIYLGDDTTDVDALIMARRLRESGACYALGLGVTADETPPAVLDHADLLADGVQDVEAFLAWLLSASST